jgi:hypothetical protein
MQRFRLLGFYVTGLVVMIGLIVGGVSLRRTAIDAAAPRALETSIEPPSPRNVERPDGPAHRDDP